MSTKDEFQMSIKLSDVYRQICHSGFNCQYCTPGDRQKDGYGGVAQCHWIRRQHLLLEADRAWPGRVGQQFSMLTTWTICSVYHTRCTTHGLQLIILITNGCTRPGAGVTDDTAIVSGIVSCERRHYTSVQSKCGRR